MTDEQKREMLEMAAKAAGLQLTWGEKYKIGDDEVDCTDLPYALGGSPDVAPAYWDPTEDDGDEARLEARLRMTVQWFDTLVFVGPERGTHCSALYADFNGDMQAARRWAGTRAAAEIGRQMQSAEGAREVER